MAHPAIDDMAQLGDSLKRFVEWCEKHDLDPIGVLRGYLVSRSTTR